MFDAALHRRVVLALALSALALSALVISCTSAGTTNASATTGPPAGTYGEIVAVSESHPPAETDHPVASMDATTASNVSATVVYEGDRLVLRAVPNQTIRLRTNASPGTTFQIEFRTNGNFHSLAEATTAVDGTAVARLDLSTVDAGTDVRLVVRYERTTVGEAPGVVIDPETTTEPSVTTSSGTTARPTTTTPTTYDESEFWSTTTATATTTPTTTAESPTEERADGVGIPGFGVPVALVGLLGALVLARRKRA